MLKPVSAALAVCLISPSWAAEGVLPASEIRKLVAGAVVEIDAPVGHKLPVTYCVDGSMTGEARGLASNLGAPSDKGHWWVEANQLCHRWERWFASETQCLSLRKEAGRIYWQNASGAEGTARIVSRATALSQANQPQDQDNISIRFTRPQELQSRSSPTNSSAPLPATPGIEFEPPQPKAQPQTAPPEGRMSIGGPRLAEPKQELKVTPIKPVAKPSVEPQQFKPHTLSNVSDPRLANDVRPQAPPPAPAFKVANVATADVLNVRSGPSAEHDIVGSLASAARGVRMTGPCRSRWCPIEHQAISGWVNQSFLTSDEDRTSEASGIPVGAPDIRRNMLALRDSPDAPRSCLSAPARALLDQIEAKFGAVRAISTCRPGARIAGTGRISRHASGNAIDFDAGPRKHAIVDWLVANHHAGGTMTYPNMDHVHVDIGPHFVSLASGRQLASRSRD